MTTSIKNFVDRVLQAIKGGDEAKVSKFHSITLKELDKQIRVRKDEIERIEDNMGDKEQSIEEYLVNLDMEKIGTAEKARAYTPQYIQRYMSLMDELQDMQEQKATKEKEIERFESMKAKLQ